LRRDAQRVPGSAYAALKDVRNVERAGDFVDLAILTLE
jgi:hypothetical protein